MLVAPLLKILMRRGTLGVVDARGKLHTFKGAPGPSVTIRLHDRSLHWKLLWNSRLVVGEAYMDGTLTLEDDATIRDFLHLVGANIHLLDENAVVKARNWLAQWVRPLQQHNPIGRARQNVAHHYDLSDDLYDLFLDPDRQYSCAYFDTPNHSLEQAQHAKKRHLASKLLLDRPGLSVLDIGSGWGGLGIYLHEQAGVAVTGLTLSREQQAYASARAQKLGIQEHVAFHLRDYREDTGTYDRVVSVGMFEHVGVKHYVEFFRTLERLLKEDGVALLHTIARWDGPSVTNPWLRKYIFPGGYCPSLSEMFAALEQTGAQVPRCGDAAPALRQYAQALVAQLPGEPRAGEGILRRALLPDVGVLPRGRRGGLPPPGSHGGPDPARPEPGRGAADPRLHGRLGARPRRLSPQGSADRFQLVFHNLSSSVVL